MYLASTSSHSPLAVFTSREDAEMYLCSLENVSWKFSCAEPLATSFSIHKIFTQAYPGYPEKTLGYVTEGVQINPDYYVH